MAACSPRGRPRLGRDSGLQLTRVPSKVVERVEFRGHPMVRSLHPRTIEVTTDEHLTESGDCIIGVGAGVGCAGLQDDTKAALRTEGSTVRFRILVGGEEFLVKAHGDARLILEDEADMVIRKSSYVCGRTLAVRADYSAREIPRKMVAALRDPVTRGALEIEVVSP